MPELPEVETVVNWARPKLVCQRITRIKVNNNYPQVIANLSPALLNKKVKGQHIRGIQRRGKLILIELERGYLTLHLRMTGQLLDRHEEPGDRHLRFTIELSDGSRLFYRDVRKFGRLNYFSDLTEIEAKYGPEPLSDAFTAEWLHDALHKCKRELKPLLLDQSFVAGIGNIYADESLWYAKLHPRKKSSTVSRVKARELHAGIQWVLQESIARNGTTFSTFFYGENASGEFVESLNIFGQNGQGCPRCGTTIVKIKVAQRGTHICPRCQRL